MKKIIILLFALVLVLCLVGCEVTAFSDAKLKEDCEDVYIWTDKETGVQYIIFDKKKGYAGMGGITPRLNADGSLYIVAESEDTE